MRVLLRRVLPRLFALAIAGLTCFPQLAEAALDPIVIQEWQVQWIPQEASENEGPPADGTWQEADAGHPLSALPKGAKGVWARVTLPPTDGWARPGLLIERLYGLDLAVYQERRLVYESRRDFEFDRNKLLMALAPANHPAEYEIRILTSTERAGILGGLRIDDFDRLSHRYASRDVPDLLLGTSIAFLACIMLLCSGYLHRRQRSSWLTLCLATMSLGMLIVCYSPLPYLYLPSGGRLMLLLFDLSLFVLAPAINFYADQVFERQYAFFTRFSRLEAVYAAICLVARFIYEFAGERNYGVYSFFFNGIMGYVIFAQLLLLIGVSVLHAGKGSRNAVILSAGLLLFALSGALDLVLYYWSDKTYVLYLWKFGAIMLLLSLVVILARRISADYVMLLRYSKELELYNHNLQRTEKLEIISDLAASIAHEVRNPLQVTRGFLQLLAGRADPKSKSYFELATNELDRASDIITDFLTFAKPEMDTVSVLDVPAELKKIESMMAPLAAMHGGVIRFHAEDRLYVVGNASKFKQAFINMIKNSIEALNKEGWIEIKAVARDGQVVVWIRDNGEGMDEEQLAQLGVPYFSTKTKGTGLGMMVTMRIIEVMRGTIEFRSQKEKGTEITIRFPLADPDETAPLPDELHL
ncbi:HAMP domain-containing sensor histidine kinase [Cohnella sp. REN36]|uniref:sensor histidine kinase n=1 Tax=Cohnella sp. REN36 TaxID=2887347 RepID=UPI001D146814|nr:HAMP domain-containing sensor histidine kinase [Cohnella sp. REN36]MCC3372700.1 HAMP domain-containing histidine kinase [Cohnella sp. REN36]